MKQQKKEKSDNLRNLKEMAQLYHTMVIGVDIVQCAYCGAPAEDREHVVPYSWMFSGARKSNKVRQSCIVMACKECNSLAGGTVFATFGEKKAYIAGCVEHRYRKVLKSPEWTDDELEELTGRLQREVFAYTQVKKFVKLRLERLLNGEIPKEVIRWNEKHG